ncbi:outer membrane protein assembly factor BamB family protein [Rhodohalobacter sulfatireducens]|uniref:PQQ-like beta-propeller repeat protein n=1 Tax=Rhodohalobacter sulfatireducens TaxID=2911366 RepID=A0ABS9KB17_9BACT|nr:PQQ-binding-like beta-propeller repeat protein [Rhodohalobacter sulfatireducens]MCG2588022.1 PQQ-like beta-propeller repeat protein [Rhodohalobacter sulfatireducens]
MRTFILTALSIIVLAIVAFILKDWFFFTPDNWERQISDIGSASSPRAVDLTGDGVLDIVMGGGAREFSPTNYGVLAFDGKDGKILWNVASRNQVIGSPTFYDINNDDIPDVIIGGRTAILFAIDGKSGNVIWEHTPSYVGMDIINDRSILNFYNIQLIPDQDGDGLKDLLTAYGGFIKAQPTDTDRPIGSLMVISSKDGSTLAKAEVPDGRETYMSPLIYDFQGDGELSVLFGTGGETINGHFYKANLQSVLEEDLSDAEVLAEGRGKGFIAPPVIANMNEDNIKDIIVNSVNGKVFCIDGSTNEILWEANLGEEFEGYTSPSPGHFNSDDTLDFFVSYGHGVWPAIDFAYQVMLDGSDGSIISAHTAGTFQYASPVTFDFSQDGKDDALVITNGKEDETTGMSTIEIYVNEMLAFDPHSQTQFRIHEKNAGSNLGSTPLLTDLDNDGYLDIIYSYMNDPINYYSFKSLRIERIEMDIQLDEPIKWGEYMGPGYDGVYKD